jgi:hypothetical protein
MPMIFKSRIILSALLFLFINGKAQTNSENIISTASELKQLYDISLLPAYRNHTREAQISTYDTTGNNDDGFSGKYSFIRRNADSSLVIFEQNGPGVINHFHTPTPTDDTLDFFINDMSNPAFSIKYKDLFSGKIFPFSRPLCGGELGGYYCYFPIAYQKGLRIVCRGRHLQFHDIQYRSFPVGTQVKSFTNKLTEEEKQLLSQIKELWNKEERQAGDLVKDNEHVFTANVSFTLNAGETKPLFNLNEGGRITGIEIEETEPDKKIYKQVDIKINWDNEKTPAVYCPLADFFGYAFGEPSMQSLLLGYKNNKHYCYYPMPFDKQASIQLTNRNSNKAAHAIAIKARVFYLKRKRDPNTEGRFYTSWNSNTFSEGGGPHIFLHTKGKGHYVGSILQSSGLHAGITQFFEGDDSTVVDGNTVIHGTGSEDYFNGGWYAVHGRWDERLSLPIHGALDYSATYSRTGGYRFYMDDKIPFSKEIYQSIEHGPVHNNTPSQYTSLALFYADKAPASFLKPTNELCKIFNPDTLLLYLQLLKYTNLGEVSVNCSWLGEDVIIRANDETLLTIYPGNIEPGKYKLFVEFSKHPEGCDFSVWQRQTQLSEWIPTSNSAKEKVTEFYVGDINYNDNTNSLSLRFKTKPGERTFLFNRFLLVKVR